MNYFNKYRIRRMVAYLIILTITSAIVLSFIPRAYKLAWSLDFNRQKIRLEAVKPVTTQIALDELTAENGYTINQSLMLINTEFMLDEGFRADTGEYKDTGVYMNQCMIESFSRLSEAVTENAKDRLYVTSTVRSEKEQQELYNEDPDTATLPGASEHQVGLAADVYVKNFAGETFLESEAGQFVNTHCQEYGFIIRYPHYGAKDTGIRFEPWHIRYVGLPHSNIIYNNKLTLEEYIFSLEEDAFYRTDNYIITRQKPKNGSITLPLNCKNYVISQDNTGCYIITAESL